jgi:hypothetical protein
MEEAPRGVRVPAEEAIYRSRTNDPLIQLDMVAPAVEGYFRIPSIWVGEEPTPETVKRLNPAVHHHIVLKQTLNAGIEVWVQRDGLFLFDFTNYDLAPQVVIPGFRKPNPNGPYRYPVVTETAQRKAEDYAILRAQIMNVHQACLTTAEQIVMRRGAGMGFPIGASSTHKAISLKAPPYYHDDVEDIRALARNVLNSKDDVARDQPLGRRTIELPVIECSLALLDQILMQKDTGIIQMVEGAYISACRSGERRFGEALILAWGVCEQAVSHEWRKLIDSGPSGRVSKERRTKLTGRDYTASVMVEMLEISNRISNDLYRSLEIARKARNHWAHEMRAPKESEVGVAIRAMEELLTKAFDVKLLLQSGGRGGVPMWNRWIYDSLKEA